MDLKKLKICWNHSRKKVDEYCQSLNDLISNNADLNEMEDCFVILENKVEELSLIDRQILKLVDESEMENQLKEIDIYKNKWLTTSKKYRDFKVKTKFRRRNLVILSSLLTKFFLNICCSNKPAVAVALWLRTLQANLTYRNFRQSIKCWKS